MGHRNIPFTGHMFDSETDQQNHGHLCPDPSIFYGSVPNFPQRNIHSIIPAPGNQCNFNFHPMQERHDSTLFYGIPPYNGIQLQNPATNLDLAVASPSGHYSQYLAPSSHIRDFPVQINHRAHDQLSLSTTHGIVGVPHIPYMDGLGGSFKRKSADGAPPNFQYHNASAGPSSSVGLMTSGPAESEADIASFQHNASHLIPGNFAARHVQLPAHPWLDMRYGGNNGDISPFTWTQLPYMQASANGACVEAGNIGVHGYQATTINRSSAGFLHPSIAQGHSTSLPPTPPMQGMGGYNVNYPSQVATSSRGVSTMSSPNTGINPYQDVVDPGPAFLGPVPPTGFRFYRPHQREFILDPNARYRNLPHLRVLPEDEVAVLEIPGYHEAGDSIDHHRDMRLDIDHMSYEELLALGERIGSVGTGLPEEFIQNSLKVKTFASLPTCTNAEDSTCSDQKKINFCVVCQTDYEHEENIGILDCGHEYHRECIKKWLVVKNTCPVCKSTGLSGKGKHL